MRILGVVYIERECTGWESRHWGVKFFNQLLKLTNQK